MAGIQITEYSGTADSGSMTFSQQSEPNSPLTLEQVAEAVRQEWLITPDKFSGNLSPKDPDYSWHVGYANSYSRFKYAVARVLQPKSILEIGVRCGLAALAFLDACPNAEYYGIDSSDGELVQIGLKAIREKNPSAHFTHKDSQQIDSFSEVDLIHIDGCHEHPSVAHDVILAIQSRSPWILCDDANDSKVMAGIFQALTVFPLRETARTPEGAIFSSMPVCYWRHFSEAGTGNLLIRNPLE